MSASDHLNGVQFMAVGDVLRMKSIDAKPELGERTVSDVLKRKDASDNGYWGNDPNMLPSVARSGVHTPLEIGPGPSLYDGHHRMDAVMRTPGITHVPVRHVTS